MYKIILFLNLVLFMPALTQAADRDMLSDIMLRERASESQVGKFLREEKKLDNLRGGVGIDIWGNRVRSELYLLKPSSNKLRAMLLTYREESLDYSWVLTTYKKDLPPSFELKEPAMGKEEIEYGEKILDFNQIAWQKYTENLENYATRIELYASNGTDYVREIFENGYMAKNLDKVDELRFENYKRIVNGTTKAEMEVINKETEWYLSKETRSGEIEWTHAGGGRNIEEIDGVPDKSFSGDVNFSWFKTTNINYEDGSWEKFEFARYSAKNDFGASELVITASEFNGRKIDLVSGGFNSVGGRGDLFDLGEFTIVQKYTPGAYGPGEYYW